jgi:Na+-transporting NADH:ubiquinone oxidoreductase subunit A
LPVFFNFAPFINEDRKKNINEQIMSEVIKIKRGLDIRLQGEAEKKISDVANVDYAVKPPDFISVFPKLFVKEGDELKAGSPLFHDKYRENIIFSSPVSGTVKEVHRGDKRKILEIRIMADGKKQFEFFGASDPKTLTREQITEKLLKSGVWPYIRQRPYSIIANPSNDPKAIFISAFDTAPLAPDCDFIIENEGAAFQSGIEVLKKLTSGKIHLNVKEGITKSRTFLTAQGVQVNRFSGPHPAGNAGIQIHHIDPINKGDIAWYLSPDAVVIIGRLFIEGRYDASKIIALTGSEVLQPKYFKVISGCSIMPMVKDNLKTTNVRFISGNVLKGTKIERSGYLGFYDHQVTVIPEGNYHEFFGWAMPRLNKFSNSKTFFSWLTPNKKYKLDTNLNGGHRAFVLTGEYEKVLPMDIYPMQLLKACLIKDLDMMENLGIYEVDEEDFALCEFIDPSKTEMQNIIREGLDYIRAEMA